MDNLRTETVEEMQQQIVDNLERLGFEGVDVSTDLSLLEYGLLLREVTEYQCSVKPSTYYQCIYVTGWKDYAYPLCYDICSIKEQEIKEIYNKEWFESGSFLKTCGMNEKQFFSYSVQMQLSDMLSYYGYENILGSSYHPLYNEDLLEWSESELKEINK